MLRRVLVPLDVAPAICLRAGGEVVALQGETMGTTWSVQCVARPDAAALRVCVERVLDGVIGEMSTWVADSDISRFNRAAAGTWHALPEDFSRVLRCALEVRDLSGGAYDPTIGALVDLWGFGPHGAPRVPDAAAIAQAKEKCGGVRLDDARACQPGGVRLDLSGIAKGFAVDKVSAALAARGITDHLVEIGGELRGHGVKPDGSPWWVALEGSDTVVALHDLAIATSGDSHRAFQHDGKRLSHTIDPRTGYPVPDDLACVTVLHRNCMTADAFATALLVLGASDGLALARRMNVAARFVRRTANGLDEILSPAMAAMLD